MAKKNYDEISQKILELVGGKENITYCIHCTTRLRFNVRDKGLVNVEELEKTEGILGTQWSGEQFQIIIGSDVKEVYEKVIKVVGNAINADVAETSTTKKDWKSTLLDTISGIFVPIIPALCGAGMLQALLSVLSYFGVIAADSQAYQLLFCFAKAAYYFLPIVVGFSTAKKLGCNEYVAVAVTSTLVYPNLAALLAGETPLTIFGIAVKNVSYASTVFPALLTVVVQSFVEKYVNKYIPKILRSVFAPMIVIIVMIPVALLVVGPLGNYIGSGLLVIVKAISSVCPFLVPCLVGLICPFVIMTGMHFASFIPMTVQLLATNGFDNVMGSGMISSNFAIGGACIAFGLLAKKLANKETAFASGFQCVLGISEPALYGICANFRTPMISSCIGGAAGGLLGGILGVSRYAQAGNSIFSWTSYMGGKGLADFYGVIACSVVAFAVAFVVQLILKAKEN